MTEGKMFLEKRVHSRLLVKFFISYKIINAKEAWDKNSQERSGNHRAAESWDASLGGMYIISDGTLKPGDHLELKISVPQGEKSLKATADVVWVDHSGAGLRFVAMKEEDVKTLEKFLNGLSKEETVSSND
jgi:hypothetical protein